MRIVVPPFVGLLRRRPLGFDDGHLVIRVHAFKGAYMHTPRSGYAMQKCHIEPANIPLSTMMRDFTCYKTGQQQDHELTHRKSTYLKLDRLLRPHTPSPNRIRRRPIILHMMNTLQAHPLLPPLHKCLLEQPSLGVERKRIYV